MPRHRRNKGEERAIARERIDRLFALAREAALSGRLDRADRYAGLAGRVATRYVVPMPREHRIRVCRACGRYMLPGVTARVRTARTRVVQTCLACGAVRRHPFLRERRAERARKSGSAAPTGPP